MFRYKKFSIEDGNTAMKVGTDGTLLGCWVDVSNANNILDVGAGSGVITIMCAQKNLTANIIGLEIDKGALLDVEQNISNLDPQWQKRIKVLSTSLQDFEPTAPIDVIVSNPPFFENSYLNDDISRSKARHTFSLHYHDLFLFAEKHLSTEGKLVMILPHQNGVKAVQDCKSFDLYATKICEVSPVPHKKPHRMLLQFEKSDKHCEMNQLVIETGIKRHDYTPEYITLGKEFYLYF